MALTDKLSAIGNAIRAKTGKTDKLTLDQMPGEIASITGGGGSVAGCVTVTFMNGNTELFSRPVYIGDDCPNPITQGHIATTPTKESTAQYDYTYSGWCSADGGTADANILKNITADKTVYAAYTSTARKYTVTFYDDDGTTVLHSQQYYYNAMPSYTPTKSGYLCTGWTPALTKVKGDASYTVIWGTVLVLIPEQSVTFTRPIGGYGQYDGTIPATGAALTSTVPITVVFDGTAYTVQHRSGYYSYYQTNNAGNDWFTLNGFGNPYARKYKIPSSTYNGTVGTLQKVTKSMSTGAASALSDSGEPFWIQYSTTSISIYTTQSGAHTVYAYQEIA